MKKNILFILILLSININGEELPVKDFKLGVHFNLWLDLADAKIDQINFKKYDKSDFSNLKELGGNIVRLPINFRSFSSADPDFVIEPKLFEYLDQVISWAEEFGIYIILDNSTFYKDGSVYNGIQPFLTKIWGQISLRYKDKSNFVMYEICNEPHDVSDYVWGNIQQNIINTIRKNDIKHTIVVNPSNWSSYKNLEKLPVYADDNLIYDFHFYDPMLFTHQCASFINPPTTSLKDIPFPYDSTRMPAFPDDLKGTWFENSFNEYNKIGNIEYLKQQIDIAIKFRNTRNVRIFCGELGVHIPGAPPEDRVLWYKTVCSYLRDNNIPFTIWDYKDVFGIYNFPAKTFPYDLNSGLLSAIGFKNIDTKLAPNLNFEIGTTDGWIPKSLEGSMLLDIDSLEPLSGSKSLRVTILTSTGNHLISEDSWKQSINWRMSLIKNAKYKICFKVVASEACSIIGSFGQNFAPYKQIAQQSFQISTTTNSYEFTSDVIPEVVGAGCFTFFFGHLEAGTQIWFDDISITEVTSPLTDGNICNGDFEADVANEMYYNKPLIYGWSKYMDGATVNYEIDQISPISGNRSMKITGGFGTPASDGWKAQLIWMFSSVVGKKYMLEFKAKGTTDFKIIAEAWDDWAEGRVNELFWQVFNITDETKNYKIDFCSATSTQYDRYFLAFWLGQIPNGSSLWLDDIKLYQYDESTTAVQEVIPQNNILIKNIYGGINIETPSIGSVYIYNLTGQLIKTEKIQRGNNQINIKNGMYILQIIEESIIVKSTKIIVH